MSRLSEQRARYSEANPYWDPSDDRKAARWCSGKELAGERVDVQEMAQRMVRDGQRAPFGIPEERDQRFVEHEPDRPLTGEELSRWSA